MLTRRYSIFHHCIRRLEYPHLIHLLVAHKIPLVRRIEEHIIAFTRVVRGYVVRINQVTLLVHRVVVTECQREVVAWAE